MKPYSYSPTKFTPELWKDERRDLMFTLLVDDFSVKYVNEKDIEHFMQVLWYKYEDAEIN